MQTVPPAVRVGSLVAGQAALAVALARLGPWLAGLPLPLPLRAAAAMLVAAGAVGWAWSLRQSVSCLLAGEEPAGAGRALEILAAGTAALAVPGAIVARVAGDLTTAPAGLVLVLVFAAATLACLSRPQRLGAP